MWIIPSRISILLPLSIETVSTEYFISYREEVYQIWLTEEAASLQIGVK
jgi:hypothetical protein